MHTNPSPNAALTNALPTSHFAQLDCAFDEMIDDVAEVEGCAGASRLVCKSEWDYKFILKFEDLSSLQGYMKNDHERVMGIHMPNIKPLIVDQKMHEQNFVCTCRPPGRIPTPHASTRAQHSHAHAGASAGQYRATQLTCICCLTPSRFQMTTSSRSLHAPRPLTRSS